MAITYKVHPAIGIARVGNSPTEYYIGPERPFEPPNAGGTFKDAGCRIKRQAVRFRVFRHDDVAGTSQDVTAEAQITWRVHVANRKSNGIVRGGSVIDPGEETLSLRGSSVALDGSITFSSGRTVSVSLGEARVDDEGRLLFLGGHGVAGRNPDGAGPLLSTQSVGWYDDTSDGRISATVTHDGATVDAVPAWVVTAPPKFAPTLDNVVTMYDVAYDRARRANQLPAAVVNAPTSYQNHVRPLLQRAHDVRWIRGVGTPEAHAWADLNSFADFTAARRLQILERLRVPGGEVGTGTGPRDMPQLGGDPTITPSQYRRMKDFADAAFVPDSLAPPGSVAITAEGLDRAALEACVGATFAPGVEFGGSSGVVNPFLSGHAFLPDDPFRLDATSRLPGSLTSDMPLPWHGDFYLSCGGWWPINRPSSVRDSGGAMVAWDRNIDRNDLVSTWHQVAFVAPTAGGELREEHCSWLRDWLVEIFEFFELKVPLPDIVSDPPPEEIFGRLARLRDLLIPKRRVEADELSEIALNLERLSDGELRSKLLDLRARRARLDAAEGLIDQRLRERSRQ